MVCTHSRDLVLSSVVAECVWGGGVGSRKNMVEAISGECGDEQAHKEPGGLHLDFPETAGRSQF